MNNPSKMDMLRHAKELTGSNDVQTLIQAASQLEQYLTFDDLKTSMDDFVEFTPHCMLEHPSKGIVPFMLQPHQKMAGYAMQFSDFTVINTSRQMGITMLNAAFLLWDASMHPNRSIVYMANTFATTSEVISRIRFMIDNAPKVDLKGHQISLFPKLRSITKNRIEFDTGSRIDTVTFNNFDCGMRGRTVDTFVIDNAAYLPHKHERDLLMHMSIARSHGRGKIIVSSTPYEAKGFFYNLWQNAEEYKASKVFLPYYMHAERDETWLEEMKKRLPPEAIENEFLCKFVDKQ